MMRRVAWALMASLALMACDNDEILVVEDGPPPPVNLDAYYYGGVVTVTWELAPAWDGETFRVYARRISDPDYFLIAEVTSCSAGLCSYEDSNVASGQTYEYYVASVDPFSGYETPSDYSIEVHVPAATAPPVPAGVEVIALDHANYIRWAGNARDADDFSFYRLYLDAGGGDEFLLGETDSEGFLDELAQNGLTYTYFVTAVDTDGHESLGSGVASGTPRPDYHGEWLFAYGDAPEASGFRFRDDETTDPVVHGDAADRHFRLETDASGWWLVPGPETGIYPQAFETTALRCGVAADAGCTDVSSAPGSGYVAQDVELFTQSSYVLRVRGDDGGRHYAVIRVELLGFDQEDRALMIFDWAYQTQADNPNLAEIRR